MTSQCASTMPRFVRGIVLHTSNSSDTLIAICDCIGVHTTTHDNSLRLSEAVGGNNSLLTIGNIRRAGPNGLEHRKVNNDTPAFKIKLCTADGDDLDQLIASALSVEDATAELARIRDLAYSFCASSTLYILSEEDMSGRMVPVLKYNSLNNSRTGPLRAVWKQNKRSVAITTNMVLDAMVTDPRGLRDVPTRAWGGRQQYNIDRNGNLRWLTTVDQTTYDNTNVPENVSKTSPILHNLLYGEGEDEDEEEIEEEEEEEIEGSDEESDDDEDDEDGDDGDDGDDGEDGEDDEDDVSDEESEYDVSDEESEYEE